MEENLICGAILSAPDIRDYHLHTKTNKFPESFELPMPEAKQQGMVGSCVAHALATIIEYYNKKEYTFHLPMSVGYIYGNRISGTHRGAGMDIRDALKDLRNEGDVPEYLFPVNVEVPDIYPLVEQCKEELRPKALPHRISSFARVYTIDEMKNMRGQMVYIHYMGPCHGFYYDEYMPYYGDDEIGIKLINEGYSRLHMPLNLYNKSWVALAYKPNETLCCLD
jgi:hypothetical protein